MLSNKNIRLDTFLSKSFDNGDLVNAVDTYFRRKFQVQFINIFCFNLLVNWRFIKTNFHEAAKIVKRTFNQVRFSIEEINSLQLLLFRSMRSLDSSKQRRHALSKFTLCDIVKLYKYEYNIVWKIEEYYTYIQFKIKIMKIFKNLILQFCIQQWIRFDKCSSCQHCCRLRFVLWTFTFAK
jgi:hypothetical protein